MSSASPTELNAGAIITLLESGTYPREVVLTFARGFLPLSQEDVIPVLAYLTATPDEEISGAAAGALADIPTRSVAAFASNEAADPAHLAMLARATHDAFILESLIRNKSLSDEAVIELASHADPAVQEIIVINQQRIIRAPRILDALLENPKLSADARRRALEVREEFFEKIARIAELKEFQEPDLQDAPLDAIVDLLEEAIEQDRNPQPVSTSIELTALEKQGEKEQNLWAKIQKMNTAQKVLLAFRGDKAARTLLVRERNKLVSSAAIRNPRITDSEAELIAGSRQVEEEVLRIIGMRRDWMAKYPIVIALCRNPRAPLGVVLPLINRLTLRDLKGLKDDKGVPDVVRSNARKLFDIRSKKT